MWFNALSVPMAKTSIVPSTFTAVAIRVIPPRREAQLLHPLLGAVCCIRANGKDVNPAVCVHCRPQPIGVFFTLMLDCKGAALRRD